MMRKTQFSARLPRAAVYARYLFPALTGILLVALSFFYLVRYYQGGEAYVQTLFRFYYNTLSASHKYLSGGNTQAGKNALYGWLTAGAVGGIFLYLLGMFFAVFALILFLRAFREKEETPAARRAKVLFKIVFPNKVCLFLSNCLFLPVAMFPGYFSMVAARVAGSSRREVLFIEQNIPLLVTGIMTALTFLLAVFAAVRGKEEHLDPFTLDRPLSVGDMTAANILGADEAPAPGADEEPCPDTDEESCPGTSEESRHRAEETPAPGESKSEKTTPGAM